VTVVFERFTESARRVVVDAQEEARRLGQGWIGCEHLLLALVRGSSATAALFRERGVTPERVETALWHLAGRDRDVDDRAALATLGIDLDHVRRAVEASFGPGALDAIENRRRRTRVPSRLRRPLARRRRCGAGHARATASGHLRFTPKAKRCLELSLRQAVRLKDGHVGDEHLALALTMCDDTAAWAALEHLGLAPGDVHRELDQARRRTA
jgi:ATP-dependent Clp protease ATP-binding subunit ClpA